MWHIIALSLSLLMLILFIAAVTYVGWIAFDDDWENVRDEDEFRCY